MNYFISMGSNVGDSRVILTEALKELSAHPDFVLLKASSLYRTKPWGKTDQPDFLNAVILADWEETPEALLTFLLATEGKFGRTRKEHWGPRTLDLDLIYAGEIRRHSTFLKLPHPLFWKRAFVLVPLMEICPDFSYEGQTIAARLAELGVGDVIKESGFEMEVADGGRNRK